MSASGEVNVLQKLCSVLVSSPREAEKKKLEMEDYMNTLQALFSDSENVITRVCIEQVRVFTDYAFYCYMLRFR